MRGTARKRNEPEPLTPSAALEVLGAALNECLRAGLKVGVARADGALWLSLAGVVLDATHNPPRLLLDGQVVSDAVEDEA